MKDKTVEVERIEDRYWIRRDGKAIYNFDLRDLMSLLEACPEEMIKILEKHRKKEKKEFMVHLERSKKEVASWPKWKQDFLGYIIDTPPSKRCNYVSKSDD